MTQIPTTSRARVLSGEMAQRRQEDTWVLQYKQARDSVNDSGKNWSRITWLLAPLVVILGSFVRPNTLTSNRAGRTLLTEILNCNTADMFQSSRFEVKLYVLLRNILPYVPQTLEGWDILLLSIATIAIFIYLSRRLVRSEQNIETCLGNLASCGLFGMYICMLGKDFLQFLIFAAAAVVLNSRMSDKVKVVLLMGLFYLEYHYWRQYFAIVLAFIPLIVYVLSQLRVSTPSKRSEYIKLIFITFFSMLIFAFVLSRLSPSSYRTIVDQHGEARDDRLMRIANNTTINSLFDVTSSSPVPLFVANWAVNTLRLMFPLELLRFGPSQWVFMLWQLYLSIKTMRIAVVFSASSDRNTILCLAVFFAFVLASGAFEPDFGSWARHESAALTIVLLIINSRTRQSMLKEEPIIQSGV